MSQLAKDWDLTKIKELDWVPSKVVEEVKAGGWFNTQKYRVLLNHSNISGKEKSIVGPHTVSVHKWGGHGGTIQYNNELATWKFYIPGTDAGGIEWTETGMVKGSGSDEPSSSKEQQGPADNSALLEDPNTLLTDPNCKNPPLTPEDPPIQKGDSSPAVLAFQNWALGDTDGEDNVPSVAEYIDISDGEDDPHGTMKWKLGTLDMITSAELMLWQGANEGEIRSVAGHAGNSEEDKQWWEKEKGQIGYATWEVLQPAMGAIPAKCAEAKEEEPEQAPDTDVKPVDSSAPTQKGKSTHYVNPKWRIDDHPKGKYKMGDDHGQSVYAALEEKTNDGTRILWRSLGRIHNYALVEVDEIGLGDDGNWCRFALLDEAGKPTTDISKFLSLNE